MKLMKVHVGLGVMPNTQAPRKEPTVIIRVIEADRFVTRIVPQVGLKKQ